MFQYILIDTIIVCQKYYLSWNSRKPQLSLFAFFSMISFYLYPLCPKTSQFWNSFSNWWNNVGDPWVWMSPCKVWHTFLRFIAVSVEGPTYLSVVYYCLSGRPNILILGLLLSQWKAQHTYPWFITVSMEGPTYLSLVYNCLNGRPNILIRGLLLSQWKIRSFKTCKISRIYQIIE